MHDIMIVEATDYTPYDWNLVNSQFLHECVIYENKLNLLEYADAMSNMYITEDVNSIKQNILNAVTKLIEIITNLSAKFRNIALQLVGKNKQWVQDTAKTSANNISNDFSFEIFPYWKSALILKEIKMPTYQDTPEFNELLNSPDNFREKYFKQLYITDGGKTEYNPKAVFRGGLKKVKINKAEYLQTVPKMQDFLNTYDAQAVEVFKENTSIIAILKKAITKIKSITLNENFNLIEHTVMSLIEADGDPATSTTLNDKPKSDPATSDTVDDSKKDTTAGSDSANVQNTSKSYQTYSKLCYEVNAARMNIMEECYNSYIRCMMAATKKEEKKK